MVLRSKSIECEVSSFYGMLLFAGAQEGWNMGERAQEASRSHVLHVTEDVSQTIQEKYHDQAKYKQNLSGYPTYLIQSPFE